jgi:hypothetical protein
MIWRDQRFEDFYESARSCVSPRHAGRLSTSASCLSLPVYYLCIGRLSQLVLSVEVRILHLLEIHVFEMPYLVQLVIKPLSLL